MPLAWEYANECLATALTIKNPKSLFKAYSFIGVLNFRENKYTEALTNYEKAHALSKSLANLYLEAKVLENMANVYGAMQKFGIAEQTYLQAMQLFNQLGMKKETGGIIKDIGVLKFQQNNFPLAQKYFEEALSIGEEGNDYELRLFCYTNIGRTYESQEKYEQALHYYEEAGKLAYLMDSDPETADALINQAAALIGLQKQQEAQLLLRRALRLSKMHDHTEGILDSYDLMKETWVAEKNADSALFYQQLYYETKENYNKANESSSVKKIVVQDDTQISKLHDEIYVLKYTIAALSVFLLILIIFSYRKPAPDEQTEK